MSKNHQKHPMKNQLFNTFLFVLGFAFLVSCQNNTEENNTTNQREYAEFTYSFNSDSGHIKKSEIFDYLTSNNVFDSTNAKKWNQIPETYPLAKYFAIKSGYLVHVLDSNHLYTGFPSIIMKFDNKRKLTNYQELEAGLVHYNMTSLKQGKGFKIEYIIGGSGYGGRNMYLFDGTNLKDSLESIPIEYSSCGPTGVGEGLSSKITSWNNDVLVIDYKLDSLNFTKKETARTFKKNFQVKFSKQNGIWKAKDQEVYKNDLKL